MFRECVRVCVCVCTCVRNDGNVNGVRAVINWNMMKKVKMLLKMTAGGDC